MIFLKVDNQTNFEELFLIFRRYCSLSDLKLINLVNLTASLKIVRTPIKFLPFESVEGFYGFLSQHAEVSFFSSSKLFKGDFLGIEICYKAKKNFDTKTEFEACLQNIYGNEGLVLKKKNFY